MGFPGETIAGPARDNGSIGPPDKTSATREAKDWPQFASSLQRFPSAPPFAK